MKGAKDVKGRFMAWVIQVGLVVVALLVSLVVIVVLVDAVYPQQVSLQDACAALEQRGGSDVFVTECVTYNCSSLRVVEVRCVT